MSSEFPAAFRRRRRAVALALLALILPLAGRAAEPPEENPPAPDATSADTQGAWKEQIVVTAGRSEQEAGNVPLQVTLVDPQAPAAATDLALSDLVSHEAPSLQLHLTSSSLVAQPRDQSLTFRGVGSGTVSRALLLVDGLPMLDPYSNSAVWSKVPMTLVERVEVVPGGGATVWGNLALSGVVNLITRPVAGRSLELSGRLAERATRQATAGWADGAGKWTGRFALESFATDGYVGADPSVRGPADEADTRAWSSLNAAASYGLSERALLGLRLLGYREKRHEGTRLDRADDEQWMAAASADLLAERDRAWKLQLFVRGQSLDDLSGSLSADHATVVPSSHIFDLTSESEGASAVWNRARGERLTLAAGADLQRIAIERREDLEYADGAFTRRYAVEGEQRLAGGFVEGTWRAGDRTSLQFGARVDTIRTRDGRSTRTTLPAGAVVEDVPLAAHTESTVNPRLGVVYRASAASQLRASAYSGFRAPAPSELFVGAAPRNNRKTAPNPELSPEKLLGGEVGWDFSRSRGFELRTTAFWSETRDLIDRIVIGKVGSTGGVIEPCGAIGPNGSCSQRQNIGKARSMGLDFDAQFRPHPRWQVDLAGTLLDAEILENEAVPALVGHQLEQTPHARATLGVTYTDPRGLVAALRVRGVGERWAEPENENHLPGVAVCDLSLSQALSPRLELFGGVENLLDRRYRYDYASAGYRVSAPRLLQIGLRFRSGAAG